MKVAVVGLDHLGSVTAACLAHLGHHAVAIDSRHGVAQRFLIDADRIEPNLQPLVDEGMHRGLLSASSIEESAKDCDVVWICYDTPIDPQGNAHPEIVVDHVTRVCSILPDGSTVVVSSQVPVGTTRRIADEFSRLSIACSPENLCHGRAVARFLAPDRVVVGIVDSTPVKVLKDLFHPLHTKVVWTTLEEAELIKHAINAFLAMEISFINELARLCKSIGADPDVISLGLKTDERIGRLAYLKPGGPYTRKTLGRDVQYLLAVGEAQGQRTPLLHGVRLSNQIEEERDEARG